jgi:hypothetical protein
MIISRKMDEDHEEMPPPAIHPVLNYPDAISIKIS